MDRGRSACATSHDRRRAARFVTSGTWPEARRATRVTRMTTLPSTLAPLPILLALVGCAPPAAAPAVSAAASQPASASAADPEPAASPALRAALAGPARTDAERARDAA